MRKAVLIGTDFAYDSGGKLVPLEINTNVGWDDVNRKETVKEIFDFTELSMYVREHTIKEICLEGKVAEICKDLIQEAIPDVPVKVISKAELDVEYSDTTLVVRTAWSPVALVDTFAANKEKFKKLIRDEDFSEDFKLPEGNLPNLVVKAIQPQYDKSEYPKFYKADVATIRVPDGYIVEPAVLNAEKLVEDRIPVFRNWSLFVADGETIDTVYLGTYTKVCGEEFDESRLAYDASGALIQGRGMLVSLDDLATQWPADALLETSDEVLMADGSWKKANDLRVGDRVKSLDLGETDIRHTGDVEISADKISDLSEASVDFLTRTRGYRDFVEITFKDKSTWFDTGKSAYMIKSGKQIKFVNIEDLKKGDTVYFLDIQTSKFDTKVVKSVETVRKYVDTYNVGLAENHVFFSRGTGETSAFASIEHNDTSDCILSPKSNAGAFQTYVSIGGNTGIFTKPSSLTVSNKTFKSTSSAKGDFVNPDDYTSSKGGFTGCWYPLSATNATWNINVPTKTGDTEYCAAILRRGSTDGEALGESRGSSVSWKLVKRGETAVLPIKFDTEDGPCEIYVTLKKPVEVVTLTDTSDEKLNATSTSAKTRYFSYPAGRSEQGSINGTIESTESWISPSMNSFNSSNSAFTTTVNTNTGFDSRSGKVRVLLHDGSVDALAVEYTISQAGQTLTLLVDPTNIEVPVTGASNLTFEKITVTTNGTWNVTTANSWITVRKAGGSSSTGDVAYTVAENTEFAQRTGKVTITATGGSQTQSETVTFVQAAKVPVLTVSPESIVFNKVTYDTQSIAITSNAPWSASIYDGTNEWGCSSAGEGTGNGTLTVYSDYPNSTDNYYTYDGSNVTLTPLTITTKIGVSGISEIVRTINMYCKSEKFIAPTVSLNDTVGEASSADLPCGQVNDYDLYWFYSTCDENGNNCSYTLNPPNYLCEWNQYYATVEGAYLLAIPIRCILGTGVSSVTFSIAGTEGLTDEPVGFDYLRLVRDDNGTSGATCVCYDDNSAGLQDTVTITSSVNPYTNGFFDIPATTSGTGSAACWCLFVGTGSGEPVSSGSITYLVEYTDPVTNETVSETKTLTFGLPPSMTIDEGGSMGSVWNGAGVGTIPVTGDAYVVSFSDLDSNTTYKVLCTEGVELSFDDGKYPVANEDTIDGSSIESFGSVGTITVEANTSTESRNIVVALVPENNGTVEDISNYDYFNECSDTDSGASKNGYYYSYVYATQDGKEEVTQKTNTINVTYNPRSLVPYDNAAVGAGVQVEYDVTASATYPVSSSVVLNEVIEDVTATDCSGRPAASPGVRTLSVGSSILKTGSSAQSFDLGWDITATPVNPSNNTFGYNNFIASPTKFGDISVSLSRPESDSYYKYQVGTVTVNAVPSLGVGTLKLTSSRSESIAVCSGVVPGLTVSCSNSSLLNTCSYSNGTVKVGYSNEGYSNGQTVEVYLKRGNNILSQRTVQLGEKAQAKPYLRLVGSTDPLTGSLSFDGWGGTASLNVYSDLTDTLWTGSGVSGMTTPGNTMLTINTSTSPFTALSVICSANTGSFTRTSAFSMVSGSYRVNVPVTQSAQELQVRIEPSQYYFVGEGASASSVVPFKKSETYTDYCWRFWYRKPTNKNVLNVTVSSTHSSIRATVGDAPNIQYSTVNLKSTTGYFYVKLSGITSTTGGASAFGTIQLTLDGGAPAVRYLTYSTL